VPDASQDPFAESRRARPARDHTERAAKDKHQPKVTD
jgi:hypothetical protein